MAAVTRLLKRVETRALVRLGRGHTSSCVIVGTLVGAGLGAAVLNAQPSTAAQQKAISTSATLPLSAYGCYNDPDGDGHIFCDGSVSISLLPASYGACHSRPDDGIAIMCRGTGW